MHNLIAVVKLGAVYQNLQCLKSLCHRPVWAVVKANAYGHGAIQVAHRLQPHVYGFCVALVQEGIALRVGGITSPILVFTPPTCREEVEQMSFYSLIATVNGVDAARLCQNVNCHIKVNTGMNRYGCSVEELDELLPMLPSQNILGVYSHLYAPQEQSAAQSQLSLFQKAVQKVKSYAPHAQAHLAASGGILCGKPYHFDAVRAGILLYGYAPSGFSVSGFRPALTLYAHRIQTTSRVGDGAAYGHCPPNITQLSTYRVGYADGLFRTQPLGNNALCMDAFVGEDRGEWLPVMTDAQVYAQRSHTIPYEVLCRVTARCQIRYEE